MTWEICPVYVFMKCETSVRISSGIIFYHFSHAYTPFSTIKLHWGVSGRRSQIPLIANLFSAGHINTRWIVNNCGTPSWRPILEVISKSRCTNALNYCTGFFLFIVIINNIIRARAIIRARKIIIIGTKAELMKFSCLNVTKQYSNSKYNK